MGAWSLADAPDVVCIAMCGAAAATDLRAYRIPNWLTASGALLGLVANLAVAALLGVAAPWSGVLLSALLGGTVLLLVSGGLGAAGLMGMGDVKLLAASGLCVRWPNALAVLVYTSLAGGVLALFLAVRRGRMIPVLRNLRDRVGMQATTSVHRMPYGVAILAGVAWAVAAKHIDGLALL